MNSNNLQWLDIPVTYLDENSSSITTLREIHSNYPNSYLVIDFWHTNCVNCPPALDKLNKDAAKADSEVKYIAVALSQGDDNFDFALELCENQWPNIIKVYMNFDDKEKVKQYLDFKAVPFYVIVDKVNNVIAKGSPRTIDIPSVLNDSRALEKSNENRSINTVAHEFKLDEDF
eukprot:gene19013-24833_t